jgi:amino acid transporter, AAT family
LADLSWAISFYFFLIRLFVMADTATSSKTGRPFKSTASTTSTLGYDNPGAPPGGDDEESPRVSSHDTAKNGLRRGLSARQVQMIAIAGTIGTGLFLGTGRSLAEAGPASMLIGYAIVAVIIYVTMLLLGEMATQYPIVSE